MCKSNVTDDLLLSSSVHTIIIGWFVAWNLLNYVFEVYNFKVIPSFLSVAVA